MAESVHLPNFTNQFWFTKHWPAKHSHYTVYGKTWNFAANVLPTIVLANGKYNESPTTNGWMFPQMQKFYSS